MRGGTVTLPAGFTAEDVITNITTGCCRLPLRQVRPEDMPGAAHGRGSQARLQAVRHPGVVKGAPKARSQRSGYTGAYMFANVLLTMAGSAILLLWGAGIVFVVSLVLLIAVGGMGVGWFYASWRHWL